MIISPFASYAMERNFQTPGEVWQKAPSKAWPDLNPANNAAAQASFIRC